MYFESFPALLHMNGHGVYVWFVVLVTVVVLIALIWAPLHRHNKFLQQQRQLLRREQGSAMARPDTKSRNADGSEVR